MAIAVSRRASSSGSGSWGRRRSMTKVFFAKLRMPQVAANRTPRSRDARAWRLTSGKAKALQCGLVSGRVSASDLCRQVPRKEGPRWTVRARWHPAA